MKLKQTVQKIKNWTVKRKNLLTVLSLVCTFAISIYNRVLGAITHSLWHESISIYYFVLVTIQSMVWGYINKSQRRHDALMFVVAKILLFILNVLLLMPIILIITDKRPVTMTLIPSIAIALYTTIKTTTTIISFVKTRKQSDCLLRQLKTINLMNVVVSILTLQNTLIAVNANTESQQGMYYLTIATSIVGFLFNMYLVFSLKRTQKCVPTLHQADASAQADVSQQTSNILSGEQNNTVDATVSVNSQKHLSNLPSLNDIK